MRIWLHSLPRMNLIAPVFYFTFFVLVVQCAVNVPLTNKSRQTRINGVQYELEPSNIEEITIVSTVDGNIHGIDQTGNKLWSASTGGPMVGAHNFMTAPMEENGLTEQFLDIASNSGSKKAYAVLPGTDGSIIYHTLDGMHRTLVNTRLLVEQAPFISKEGFAFSSNKRSRLMSFDVNSGELLFDTEASEWNSAILQSRHRTLASSNKESKPLWFGRIDYSVRAVDLLTGMEEFNITYSELHPLPFGNAGAGSDAYSDKGEGGGEGGIEGERNTEDPDLDDPVAVGFKDSLGIEVIANTALEDVESVGFLGDCAGGACRAEDGDLTLGNTRSQPSSARRVGQKGGGSSSRRARRKSRRKSKSRVRMERRAGLLEELHPAGALPSSLPSGGSATAAAAQGSSLSSLALISTPDGELYFSDFDGTVIEKVPVSLQSPVISAFKVKRKRQQPDQPAQHEQVTPQQVEPNALPAPTGDAGTGSSSSSSSSSSVGMATGRMTKLGGGGSWDIRRINVQHRLLTYAPTNALTTVAATGSGAAEHTPQPFFDTSSIIVQSSAVHGDSSGSSLYVLEVTDLEMPNVSWEPDPPVTAVRSGGTSDPEQQQPHLLLPMISSSIPPSDVSRNPSDHQQAALLAAATQKLHRSSSRSRSSGGRFTKRELLSSAEERIRLGLLRNIKGSETLHAKPIGEQQSGLQELQESDNLAGAIVASPFAGSDDIDSSFLPTVCEDSSNVGTEDMDSAAHDIPQEEASLMLELRSTIAAAESAAAVLRAAETVDKHLQSLQLKSPSLLMLAVPPGMRGPHKLRDALYDVPLFTPDETMDNLFGGVLSTTHTATAAAVVPAQYTLHQNQQTRHPAFALDGSTDNSRPSPATPPLRPPAVAELLTPRARLESFVARAWAIVEVVLLFMTAGLVVAAAVFVGAVAVVRNTPALSHLLPAQESFPVQLQFAIQALLGRIVGQFVPAAVGPSRTQLSSARPLSRARSASALNVSASGSVSAGAAVQPSAPTPTSADLQSSSSQSSQRIATPAPELSAVASDKEVPPASVDSASTAPTQTQVVVPSTAAVAATTVVPPAAESFDAEGRRLVHVGSLVVHSQCVLGYGSHGTVVYRGSLHGRPLAVKRILSQFVRSADREISLLIRSDGHPNVVRYYTKEVQNDFVYLGLQLCDMTLKDFVLNVKCKRSLRVQDGKTGEDQTSKETDVAITDNVKGSLLQIAQGLAHLHSQRIVHRDIKPQNILCASPHEALDETAAGGTPLGGSATEDQASTLDDLSAYVLKISDMGLSKQLGRENFSFSSMSLSMAAMSSTTFDERTYQPGTGAGSALSAAVDSAPEQARAVAMMQATVGTVGWQAPELISHRYAPKSGSLPLDVVSESATPSSGVQMAFGEQDDSGDSEVKDAGEEGELDAEEVTGISVSIASLRTHAQCPHRQQQQQQQQRSQQLKLSRDRKKRTLTVDVFSLGCVFYFTLTLGEHPYGEWFEREANIAAGKADLSLVQHDLLAVDLISWMLHGDPLLRPSSREVCQHAFFWAPAKKLDFLVEFSDRLEHELADSVLVLALEVGAQEVIGSRWDRHLDGLLLADLGKYRKYDTASVRDLLRVMRNKRHHFHELSAELKQAMGSIPGGFLSYFEARFPRLVLHCAQVANTYLSSEQLFKQWAACTSTVYRSKRSTPPSSSVMSDISPTSAMSEVAAAAEGVGLPKRALPVDNTEASHAAVNAGAGGVVSLSEVVVWQRSALAAGLQYTGWWRSDAEWVAAAAPVSAGGPGTTVVKKARPSHLSKAAADPKYRTRLCSHWEGSLASNCPMRKKGKCIFAHGPLELRVRENRRDKWGSSSSGGGRFPTTTAGAAATPALLLVLSGGEDVLGAARSADKTAICKMVNEEGVDGSSEARGLSIDFSSPVESTSSQGNSSATPAARSSVGRGGEGGRSRAAAGGANVAGVGLRSGDGTETETGLYYPQYEYEHEYPTAPFVPAMMPAGMYQQLHQQQQYLAGVQAGQFYGETPHTGYGYNHQHQQQYVQQLPPQYHNPYASTQPPAGNQQKNPNPPKQNGAAFFS